MKRPSRAWTAFAAALVPALAVMVYFTVRMLEFEQSIAKAQAHAALEETVRLALWRMDSAATLLLKEPAQIATAEKAGEPPAAQENNESALGDGQTINRQVSQQFEPAYQTQRSKQELQRRQNLNQMPQSVGPALEVPPVAPGTAGSEKDKNAAPAASRDWREIAPQLLEQIEDILPGCRLEGADSSPDDTRQLASIPARLVVPESARPDASLPWNTPLRISLMVAWVLALVAAGSLARLMSATLSLSERRGAFASAVTHELRTPLTTLRMYAELLADGKIDEPGKRQQYLQTLVAESDRLGHLVENVLAYSRLENRLSARQTEPLSVDELVEQGRAALERRAAQSGLGLTVRTSDAAVGRVVRVDPIAVQQILINLVDNACKYAATAMTLEADAPEGGARVELSLSDQGPGIAPGTRLFEAFSKAKNDPIPGIGLGLFLSRQLARGLGGELEYRPGPGGKGATFVLVLEAQGERLARA